MLAGVAVLLVFGIFARAALVYGPDLDPWDPGSWIDELLVSAYIYPKIPISRYFLGRRTVGVGTEVLLSDNLFSRYL